MATYVKFSAASGRSSRRPRRRAPCRWSRAQRCGVPADGAVAPALRATVWPELLADVVDSLSTSSAEGEAACTRCCDAARDQERPAWSDYFRPRPGGWSEHQPARAAAGSFMPAHPAAKLIYGRPQGLRLLPTHQHGDPGPVHQARRLPGLRRRAADFAAGHASSYIVGRDRQRDDHLPALR